MIQEPLPEWPDRDDIIGKVEWRGPGQLYVGKLVGKDYLIMRREPEQRTIRGKGPGPMKPGDPERKRGDGMRAAEGSRKDGGTEKGRPTRAADPEKKRGDGMKVAMRGEAGKASKLSPSKAERERVR